MKKWKSLALATLTALTMAGAPAEAAPTPEEARQIDILARTATGDSGWFAAPEKGEDWTRWMYTVTDLDHDGQLEIFKAKRGGDNAPPWLQCEELDAGKETRHYGIYFAGGTDIPDILSSESAGQATVLHDTSDDAYHYIFTEVKVLNEFARQNTLYALTLSGDLIVEELAALQGIESGYDGSLSFRYYLPGWRKVEAESGQPVPPPEEIDAERYRNITDERFPGCEKKVVLFMWLDGERLKATMDKGQGAALLAESYGWFRGDHD